MKSAKEIEQSDRLVRTSTSNSTKEISGKPELKKRSQRRRNSTKKQKACLLRMDKLFDIA